MKATLSMAKHAAKYSRRVLRLVSLIIAVLFSIAVLHGLGLFRWSCLNCSQDEIDIGGGRIRHSYLVLCIPVYQSVRDSALTMALSDAERRETAKIWRKVNVFSPGVRYSPHYA